MDELMLAYIGIGFFAQMIDGALGMAYGVTTNSFLLSIGIPPAAASASVHTAKIFTNGIGGLFHIKFGNVDKNLFKRLVIPGVAGAVVGAYLLSTISGETIKPFINGYLLIMGVLILKKMIKKNVDKKAESKVFSLGAIGGFCDAIGGGGWGPIVTSTLVRRGHSPRFAIGSVNLAEFFVATAAVAIFIATIGIQHFQIILGLIIGGALAAPLSAYACKKIPAQGLMIIVGLLIVTLSVRELVLAFTG